jgi:hypothetical protein
MAPVSAAPQLPSEQVLSPLLPPIIDDHVLEIGVILSRDAAGDNILRDLSPPAIFYGVTKPVGLPL